jgi:hypothetical protein
MKKLEKIKSFLTIFFSPSLYIQILTIQLTGLLDSNKLELCEHDMVYDISSGSLEINNKDIKIILKQLKLM